MLLSSCAIPQGPTGGPPDETPPSLRESAPAANSTNIRPGSVHLTFSEYVDKSSFQQSLSVTPPFEEPLSYDWNGRTVTVDFPADLRPNTTYVLTVGTRFQDLHGVQLQEPIVLAFSTGSTLNKHTLSGQVVDALSGQGLKGYEVFAYLASSDTLPDPRSAAPAYRSSTGSDGQFTLSYLPDTLLFVTAVEDLNRNYRLDAGESFAVPNNPRLSTYPPDTSAPTATFVQTRIDTTRPELRQLRSLSSTRSALLFSEPVRLDTLHPNWQLTAANDSTPRLATAAYQAQETLNRIVMLTPPLSNVSHELVLAGGIQDTAGNALVETVRSFTPISWTDTLDVRLTAQLPPVAQAPYPSSSLPALRFNRFVAPSQVAQSAVVTDSSGTEIPGTWQTANGTAFFYHPTASTALHDTVTIELNGDLVQQDTTYYHSIAYLSHEQYGSISGTVIPPTEPAVVLLKASDKVNGEPVFTASTDSTGAFTVDHVPAGYYHIRLFRDLNRNRQWDGGQAYPFSPPEPIRWSDSTRVRARWETDLDTLQLSPVPLNQQP